jgi:3-deoxy-7-phosphoheptulonate synthase
VIHIRGNAHAHIVLRGGGGRTNYNFTSVTLCEQHLLKANTPANIMIDCSHANSSKDPRLQPLVTSNAVDQIVEGNQSIVGLMVESNLERRNQPIPKKLNDLKYGISVTDPFIDWDTSETMIRQLRNKLKDILPGRRTMGTE